MSWRSRARTVHGMHPAQRIASVPRRPTRLDLAIVAALLAWALAEALLADGSGPRWLRAATACAVVLPLLAGRRQPVAAMRPARQQGRVHGTRGAGGQPARAEEHKSALPLHRELV